MDYEEQLQQQFKRAVGMSYLLMGCIVFYGIVTYLLIENLAPRNELIRQYALIRNILLIVSILGLAIIPKIREYVLERHVALSEEATSTDRAPVLIGRLMTSTVVAMALCENPALFGCILAVLSRNMNEFYMFGGIAVFGLLTNRPQYNVWMIWIKHKLKN